MMKMTKMINKKKRSKTTQIVNYQWTRKERNRRSIMKDLRCTTRNRLIIHSYMTEKMATVKKKRKNTIKKTTQIIRGIII